MKRLVFILAAVLLAVPLSAQDPVLVIKEEQQKESAPVTVHFSGKRLEPIKDINGVNMAPALKYSNDDFRLNWFTPLNIGIWRAHDMGHLDPGLNHIDLNHIFPVETADPSRREFYDFSTTDAIMKQADSLGLKTLWHMGSSIENMDEYHYEIHPPKSAKRWAESAVNVLEHYAQGKWDGFHYDIPYVEVWNEPDNRHCWSGTMDEFIDFYITASKHIKKACPWIKVGGPAFCNGKQKICKPFIDACAEAGAPLDFFSFHWYVYKDGDDSMFFTQADDVRRWLDEAGFTNTEIFLDEWHPISGWKNVNRILDHDWSAVTASVMLGYQDSHVDKAFFYTGNTTGWGYAAGGKIQPVYYAAKAVGELKVHPTRMELSVKNLPTGSRILSGMDAEGNVAAVLALVKTGRTQVTFDISDLGEFKSAEVRLFDKGHNLELIAMEENPGKSITIQTQESSSVLLLNLRKSPSDKEKVSSVTLSSAELGRFKPLNGGNNGPTLKSRGVHFKNTYYGAMQIPITRVSNECRENSGMRIVSTNQIFPLPAADPSDRQFYDFRASDDYLAQIKELGGSGVFYCLSASDERLIHRQHFRISPPDTQKWSAVCENIINHFNYGKWGGSHSKIAYWEIWDEPDNPHHWDGSLEDYFSLYVHAAKYLKSKFPELKFGGPCFGSPTEEKVAAFIAACRKAEAPLDFFTYKLFSYEPGDFSSFVCSADRVRELLDKAGFKDTEIVVSAWHPLKGQRDDMGLATGMSWAALSGSIMLRWQDKPVDLAMFESVSDKAGGVYSVPKPNCLYYVFLAMADLMRHPVRISSAAEGFSPQSSVAAGKNAKGDVDVLLCLSKETSKLTEVDFTSMGTFSSAEVYLQDTAIDKLSLISTIRNPEGKVCLSHPNEDSIILLKLIK
ncbi:MAG: hypothetical protein IJQ61_08020 [Bacteroidales bacterium]|nr:hypothetical protein [Bacteroidales bacterium]